MCVCVRERERIKTLDTYYICTVGVLIFFYVNIQCTQNFVFRREGGREGRGGREDHTDNVSDTDTEMMKQPGYIYMYIYTCR